MLADAANQCNAEHGGVEEEVCIMTIDISRAYFYAEAQRDIYIKFPPRTRELEME